MEDDKFAKLAWDTYSKAVGGVAFNGDKLPTWEAMVADPTKQKLVAAWRATAEELVSEARQ